MHFLDLLSLTYLDDEPPGINGCPDDAIIPAASTIPVPHSWVPPVFTDNSGQSVDVVFGCSATVSNECHQDGYGTFSVGDTKVMYNGTDASVNHNFCNFTITITGALQCDDIFAIVIAICICYLPSSICFVLKILFTWSFFRSVRGNAAFKKSIFVWQTMYAFSLSTRKQET